MILQTLTTISQKPINQQLITQIIWNKQGKQLFSIIKGKRKPWTTNVKTNLGNIPQPQQRPHTAITTTHTHLETSPRQANNKGVTQQATEKHHSQSTTEPQQRQGITQQTTLTYKGELV